MGGQPDVNLARRAMLCLRMAFQTEVEVALDQQFAVHRTVGAMTHGAAFPQRLMLENERTGLLAMTFGTALVQPSHRQAAGGLKNVATMRIMALHAIHPAFGDRMMLRKAEFSVDV